MEPLVSMTSIVDRGWSEAFPTVTFACLPPTVAVTVCWSTTTAASLRRVSVVVTVSFETRMSLSEPGTPSADPVSDVRCRRVTIPAAGTYQVSAGSESGQQRSLVALTEQGTLTCGSTGVIAGERCDFPAAGTYTLVADGNTAGIKGGAFSATVAAVE